MTEELQNKNEPEPLVEPQHSMEVESGTKRPRPAFGPNKPKKPR